MSGHEPTVPLEEAVRMREWHDDHYATLRGVGEEGVVVDYLGLNLVIPRHVQIIEDTSDLLGNVVRDEVRATDRVLDMGTGSGVNAILAAQVASEVVAVDVNPHAVEAARANAERNQVADLVDVHLSDVFTDVEGTFDLIIFDPPFRWFRPRDWAEASITDENYRALTTFFEQVRSHLAEDGRVLVFFGTTADIGYLESLMSGQGFEPVVVARRSKVKDGHGVEYLVWRFSVRRPRP